MGLFGKTNGSIILTPADRREESLKKLKSKR